MKRKLLCIAVAVIMILPLAFAAIPTASAAVADGWVHTATGGASVSNFRVTADGTLTIEWGASVDANLSAGYDASAYNDNYTVTVDFFVPATHKVSIEDSSVNANPVVSLRANYTEGAQDSWVSNGVITKICNYENVHGEDMYANWGNTWLLIENFDNSTSVAFAASSYADTNIVSGAWNTYKATVNGNAIQVWVNDVLVMNYTDEEKAGDYIYLSTNGCTGNWDNATSFKNFKIVSNDDSVADYEAYTETAWSVIKTSCLSLGGAEANGVLEATNNGELFLNNTGAGWFARVGTSYDEKVAVDGLEIKFVMDNIAESDAALPGLPAAITQYMNINLSKDKATDFVGYDYNGATPDKATMKNPMASNATGLNVTASTSASLVFMLLSDRTSWTATGGMYSAIPHTYANPVGTYADNAEHTVKFVKNGDNIDILIDGEVAMSFVAADVLDADGKAYLSFSANSYGNAAANMTIKTINGQAANEFVPETAINDPVIVGAQYRTEGAAGIRFLTEVALNDVNNNETIKKMGTLIMPADKLGTADLVLTENGKIGETSYLDIVARNYYEKTDDMISFTAVLTGIPEDEANREFTAVSYIEYTDGTIVYSGAYTASVAGLQNA